MATMSRPVTARASFTAAVVTFDPFLANFTILAPAMHDRKVLCALELEQCRPGEVHPAFQLSAAKVAILKPKAETEDRSVTGSHACPSVTARSAEPYSISSFSSTSDATALPADDDRSDPLGTLLVAFGIGVCAPADTRGNRGMNAVRERL
jgi:hypothetical protein